MALTSGYLLLFFFSFALESFRSTGARARFFSQCYHFISDLGRFHQVCLAFRRVCSVLLSMTTLTGFYRVVFFFSAFTEFACLFLGFPGRVFFLWLTQRNLPSFAAFRRSLPFLERVYTRVGSALPTDFFGSSAAMAASSVRPYRWRASVPFIGIDMQMR